MRACRRDLRRSGASVREPESLRDAARRPRLRRVTLGRFDLGGLDEDELAHEPPQSWSSSRPATTSRRAHKAIKTLRDGGPLVEVADPARGDGRAAAGARLLDRLRRLRADADRAGRAVRAPAPARLEVARRSARTRSSRSTIS